ncbi:MAG: ParB/RepB/Spo0J family partition protein [Halobacteriovoraceae bacterium]|jgi:ParB family transcriptional regulator, chromosome partitioning protein|nr:ParB/RepB/Spo0J family partition protein [Halobacteriovoraceae bacterium]
MSKSKLALGKGMSALLSNSSTASNLTMKDTLKESPKLNEGPTMVPIEKIKASKDQPRKIFKDKELLELSNSIKEIGLIQPISVYQEDKNFIIIAGERRYRASKLAGLKHIPVIIKKATKKETLVMAIVENVQRSDLNCVEEALAYYQLMNEFSLTQEEVAKKIGKERSTIANFLRILKLPREVVKQLQKEELSFGHAKVLAALKDDEFIKRIARMAIDQSMSVRELEKTIKINKKSKPTAKNKFFDDQLDAIKQKLEARTGYHFDLKTKNNGSGTITIKFSNEAEFNDIFDYLAK